MGTVWAARHELLGRDFALKFARVPSKTDPTVRARFQREAQLVGKLRHPNIVDVTDFGEVGPDGDFFLAMELLDGESLADRIAQHGPLDSYEAVTIGADVARGLSTVHAVGIVHRDIKPENIFLARSPTGTILPKLLDFGISKEWNDSLATQQGTLTGTPAYMSPEQANGETTLDPRTDIWSLGVVLYEMLTNRHPFVEPNYQALMSAIAERPHMPLPTSVPPALRRVIDRCLAKRPDDRFANGEDLASALGVIEPRDRASISSHPLRQKSTRGLVVGIVAASILLGGGAFWISRMRETPTAIATVQPSANTSVAAPIETPSMEPPTAQILTSAKATSSVATSMPQPTTRPSGRTPDKRVSTSVTTPGF